MARARLTPELAGSLAARLAVGVSIADAARVAGVHPKTLGRWLARGRREDVGPYRSLVVAVEEASRVREEEALARAGEELTEAEARVLLSRLARGGSVPALRLYVERFLRATEPLEQPRESEAASILSAMDELAAKRAKRAG